jgi:hypothetical protein
VPRVPAVQLRSRIVPTGLWQGPKHCALHDSSAVVTDDGCGGRMVATHRAFVERVRAQFVVAIALCIRLAAAQRGGVGCGAADLHTRCKLIRSTVPWLEPLTHLCQVIYRTRKAGPSWSATRSMMS